MRLHSLSQLLKIFLSLLDSLLERLLCLLQLLLQDKQMRVNLTENGSRLKLQNFFDRTFTTIIHELT